MQENTLNIARQILAQNERLLGLIEADVKAKVEAPVAAKPQVSAPKEAKPEVKFRSVKAKATGRETAAEIWARHYAEAGVKRFKDLTPAQAEAAKAEVSAAWKAVKPTRKTKAA